MTRSEFRPATVLMPLPMLDFDPTEVAVSWNVLTGLGHKVAFATPLGEPACADGRMLTGKGLDFWSWIPGLRNLRLLGLILRADAAARAAYARMSRAPAFLKPRSYEGLTAADYDGLLLPGGHRPRGMRPYLEDGRLHRLVVEFFEAEKPVAAICHGTVLAARSCSRISGKSVLWGRKTTGLTWKLEWTAWTLMKALGRFWDPGYYRTYREGAGEPTGYRGVEAEVSRALADTRHFLDVDPQAPSYFRKASGLFRDSLEDARPAWVVRDGNYVSARWPGDANTFAKTFAAMLMEEKP